jgi:hypothetical protein
MRKFAQSGHPAGHPQKIILNSFFHSEFWKVSQKSFKFETRSGSEILRSSSPWSAIDVLFDTLGQSLDSSAFILQFFISVTLNNDVCFDHIFRFFNLSKKNGIFKGMFFVMNDIVYFEYFLMLK